MTEREDQITQFLTQHGWRMAARTRLAGDASLRSYERLTGGQRPAMLMNAPPETGEDVRPFLRIAEVMRTRGLSVPDIIAADRDTGLLILEDLGPEMFATVAQHDPEKEVTLYTAAAEMVAAMQQAPPPADLPRYMDLMANLSGLALDWYAPEHRDRRADLVAAMAQALDHPALAAPTLVHRDFHADNLIWLPERVGVARVGLLDFQDAMQGPADYDLASLIHDPRRHVTDTARLAATQAYIAASGRAPEDVAAGIAICSAQRCLRILGVFARLCLRDGKRHYPDFIPRTWAALTRDLTHPALADVRAVVSDALPAPTQARLDSIRARGGQLRGQAHA